MATNEHSPLINEAPRSPVQRFLSQISRTKSVSEVLSDQSVVSEHAGEPTELKRALSAVDLIAYGLGESDGVRTTPLGHT